MLAVIESEILKLQQEFFSHLNLKMLCYDFKNSSDFSLDWQKNDSVIFTGDNLVALRKLLVSGSKAIDLCYIDPPYNTGSSFLYHDKRKSPEQGVLGSHQEWMQFMLPRLVAARELLKNTGIIAISIDDYEFPYLKVLMDRIFEEKNFIGNIVICRSKNGKGSKKNLASSHEYLVVYGKTEEAVLRGESDKDTVYDKEDKNGKYRVDGLFRKKGEASLRLDRPSMFFPLFVNIQTGEVSVDAIDGWKKVLPLDSKGVERRWLWGVDTTRERSWQLFGSKNGVVYVKNYAGKEDGDKRKKIRTLWDDPAFYTERATNEITQIFGAKVFDTPKPVQFIKKIIDSMSHESALILDFFAGSGTTAQAAFELNNEDQGNRKCILMESTDEISMKHTAYKAGYHQISDITLARLEYLQKIDPSYKFQVID